MGLAAVNSETEALPGIDLDELQWEQFQHDELYHREIVRLSLHNRWKHMALHFAKYAGKLAAKPASSEEARPIVIDTLIIALSTSNTLNIKSSELIAGKALNVVSVEEFLQRLVVSAGQMAAACEKLDHIEPVGFKQDVTNATAAILSICLSFGVAKSWPLSELVRSRLQDVKQKWIHHSRQ